MFETFLRVSRFFTETPTVDANYFLWKELVIMLFRD